MTTAVHHPPTTAANARHNQTTTERVVRVALGLAAVVAGALLLATTGSVLAYRLESLLVLAGLVLVVIGVSGYSPFYGLLGHVPASLRASDPDQP
ncbi:MAG TPA: DUF2892 domain-containing protein [Acidimicrobiales bacterium]|nr:MAG: hypothetical protein B7Z69_09210 [Actinobacteria bacterium 21-73-9]HQU27205.1 DUF2892 domain-containing protein [Acidimicrobiales bacterium]